MSIDRESGYSYRASGEVTDDLVSVAYSQLRFFQGFLSLAQTTVLQECKEVVNLASPVSISSTMELRSEIDLTQNGSVQE